MSYITFKELIGKEIEGLYLIDGKFEIGEYEYSEIHLKLSDGRYVLLDLLDPEEAHQFEISNPRNPSRIFDASDKVAGIRICDVIKSDNLSNIGVLLENNCLIVNSIGEFRNRVELLANPEIIFKGDFVSLVRE